MAESCNKFLFRVLLPDGHNLTLELENADEKMSVAEFVHIVRRQAEKQPLENRFRKIHWGPQVHIQDNGGKRIEDGKIICQDSRNKVKVIFLQDGDINSVHMHQNTWNVTPEPQLLGERPQDYTFQTASADLIDNFLQLRVNGSGEKRFIRGTMNSSNHRAMRGSVTRLRPPYLKEHIPFMESKRKRVENVQVPQHYFKRDKHFVESNAGFASTTSKVNNPYANLMSTEANTFVEASEKVGKWKLSFQLADTECTEIKRLNVRLGSEIGPFFISCYDVYSNRMAFKAYPRLEVQIHKMETPVKIKIEKASGRLTEDRMYLHVSKILLGGGKLDQLRPSFEASLRVGSKDSCFVELPLAVLPGDMCSVKLSNSELDNCLRPGDVIHKLKLQVLDAYGNPIEKGRKIEVKLRGLEFQGQDDPYRDYREVDDQGWVNFGGLLKVTGKYGSKGCIRVSSDTKTLLIKEFDLLSRKLKVVSGIPDHSNAGSILKNVVFGIFDDEGNIDSKMDGYQHTLIVDLCTLSPVQYTFIQGKCMVPKLQLPEDIGLLEFKASHSWHTELFVHIKVQIIANTRLEIVSVPEQPLDDGAVCHAYDENKASQSQISNPIMVNEVKLFIEDFISDATKWEDEWKLHGSKVEKHEYELRKLQTNKSEVNKSLSDLERELNQCTFSSKIDGKGMPIQSSHTVEDILEEIKRQGTTAASLWLDLSRRCVQSIQSPIIQDVIGVVALLGKVEDDVLSRALSEYLGRENMLALVCKSRVGAEALEHYDHSGNIVTDRGLHGLASAQKAKINGRFRVICLEDIRSYEGGFKVGDPQKQLIIEDPKSSDGILPEGYMGYAVNMIKLDHEELCPSTSSGIGLRGTLFFNLFSYLQVYKTRNHMKQATSYITDGAVSLDGAMLRRKGVTECGNRDKVSVKFPTTSAKTMSSFFHLRADIEEKIVKKKEEKKMLEKQIRRTRDKLKRLKNNFENKKKELEEREARKNMFLENCQQRGLLLENHEQSDKIIDF